MSPARCEAGGGESRALAGAVVAICPLAETCVEEVAAPASKGSESRGRGGQRCGGSAAGGSRARVAFLAGSTFRSERVERCHHFTDLAWTGLR